MLTTFLDTERLIHSLKTAIACLIGLFFAHVMGLQSGQWVVITILVIMCAQLYVGSVLQKSYLRLLGTVAGCAVAIAMILSGQDSYLAIALTLAFSSFIFSYLATWNENWMYAGTLGAVTTVIIILGQHPTIDFALERFTEISIGILIATLVSQFILPIHARTHLRHNQAHTLEQLRDCYQVAMMTTKQNNLPDFSELDELVVKSLLKQRQLARESARERMGKLFDPPHFVKTLRAEREMLRAVMFMQGALAQLSTPIDQFMLSEELRQFNERIVNALNVLIRALRQETTEEHIHLPDLAPVKEALQQDITVYSREELIYLDGFLFCAEMLVNGLGRLAALYEVKVYSC